MSNSGNRLRHSFNLINPHKGDQFVMVEGRCGIEIAGSGPGTRATLRWPHPDVRPQWSALGAGAIRHLGVDVSPSPAQLYLPSGTHLRIARAKDVTLHAVEANSLLVHIEAGEQVALRGVRATGSRIELGTDGLLDVDGTRYDKPGSYFLRDGELRPATGNDAEISYVQDMQSIYVGQDLQPIEGRAYAAAF